MEEEFSLDYNGIMELSPVRYPYLFIDRVERLIPGKLAIGYKNLSINEWFFPIHFSGDPLMPGFLQAEALTQMGALTIQSLEGNKGKIVYLSGANNLRLYKKVRPGDKLEMHAELLSYKRGIGQGIGKAYVDNKLVSSVEMILTLAGTLPVPKFESGDIKRECVPPPPPRQD
jgi:3-hydroxyacyl-[acyl-carrier-protein] dehydratase